MTICDKCGTRIQENASLCAKCGNGGAYYKPSGKCPNIFFGNFLLSLVIAIPILAVIYAYLIRYIPIIYLNIIITGLCGGAIGGIVWFAAKFGKARNPAIVFICTLIATCAFQYVQYCAWIPLWFDLSLEERFSYSFSLLFSPSELIETMKKINEMGLWSMGRSGSVVNGIMLLFVWIVEFIIIAGVAIFASRQASKLPFSEKANSWYAKIKREVKIDVPENLDALKVNLEKADFAELVSLSKEEVVSKECLLCLSFFEPPPQLPEEPYYLRIMRMSLSNKTDIKNIFLPTVVEPLAIDKQSVMEILGISPKKEIP